MTTRDGDRFVIKREFDVAPLVASVLASRYFGFSNPGLKIYKFDDPFSVEIVSQSLATENTAFLTDAHNARELQKIDPKKGSKLLDESLANF